MNGVIILHGHHGLGGIMNFTASSIVSAIFLMFSFSFEANALSPATEHLLRTKQYEKAMVRLEPLARHGDAEAQAYVGYLYEGGFGVSQSYSDAFS